jgi:thiol-disulfide isomerase/thioredoxin
MKTLIPVFTALLLSTASYCQLTQLPLPIEDAAMSSYLQKKGNANLQISIINTNTPVEGIQVKYTTVRMGPECQRTGYTKLNAKGEANIVLTDGLPYQQVWLDIENYIYTGLLVNTGLTVQIDAAKLSGKAIYLHSDALMLQGADADLNNTINKSILFRKKDKEGLWNTLHDAGMGAANKIIPIPQFLRTADSVYQCLQKIVAGYPADNRDYKWAIINELNSQYLGILAFGFVNNLMPDSIYKRVIAHTPYFTSNEGAGFYRYLRFYSTSKADNPKTDIQKKLYANKPGLTSEQRSVLDSIGLLESFRENSENKKLLERLHSKRYRLFGKEIDLIRDRQNIINIDNSWEARRADIIKLWFLEDSKDRFREIYPVLLRTMKTNWTRSYVQKQLDEAIVKQDNIDALFTSAKNLASDNHYIGKPLQQLPFNASLYLLDSIKNIDGFILNLKNKFANKALILDFWATWCAPCLSDMPYSKKLHRENESLPIEYVYLCTSSGSDPETWKKRIGDMKLPGTHIYMEDELMVALRKQLNAEGGYPTYVVIDAKGNMNTKSISFMSQLNAETLKSVTGIR